MHDDIMDNAPLRRSFPTIHEKWNRNVAILSGDALYTKAFQLIMDVPDYCLRDVLNLFTKTALEVCEGQQLDMDFENDREVSIELYIDMIRLKTAVLLGASLGIGAIIAKTDKQDVEHLYSFGMHIGIAFQLQDDILDVYGESAKFGKQVGGDIIANKKTFLLLTALNDADGQDKIELNELIYTDLLKDRPEEKINSVVSLFNRLDVRQKAEAKMIEHYNTALSHLNAIQIDEARKQPLKNIAEGLMKREM
jgi:geranylgeranyl diphosphate synthase type II